MDATISYSLIYTHPVFLLPFKKVASTSGYFISTQSNLFITEIMMNTSNIHSNHLCNELKPENPAKHRMEILYCIFEMLQNSSFFKMAPKLIKIVLSVIYGFSHKNLYYIQLFLNKKIRYHEPMCNSY